MAAAIVPDIVLDIGESGTWTPAFRPEWRALNPSSPQPAATSASPAPRTLPHSTLFPERRPFPITQSSDSLRSTRPEHQLVPIKPVQIKLIQIELV
jgi:hypothetical protein